MELSAAAAILPMPKENVSYDESGKFYKVSGLSTQNLRRVDDELFEANKIKVLFIVLVEGQDEPQVEMQDYLGNDLIFYVRADLENQPHNVLIAYSNGVLMSKSKPLWLTPVMKVSYKYSIAQTVTHLSSYNHTFKATTPLSKSKLVLSMG